MGFPRPAAAVQLDLQLPEVASCARERLRAVAEEAKGLGTEARQIVATVTETEGHWQLVIRDQGEDLLRREVPSPVEDCTGSAATLELVLHRYLTGIESPAEAPSQVPALASPEPSPPEPSPPEPSPPEPSPPEPSPPEPGSAVRAGLGATSAPGLGRGLSAGAIAQAEVRRKEWSLSLELTALLPETIALEKAGTALGSYSVARGAPRLGFARSFDTGAGELVPGLSAGVELTRVAASGDGLFRTQGAWAAHPSLGVDLGWQSPEFAASSVLVRAEARVTAGGTRFEVAGATPSVATPRFDFGLSLLWSRELFR